MKQELMVITWNNVMRQIKKNPRTTGIQGFYIKSKIDDYLKECVGQSGE